jgi:hypothetical protein
MESKANTVHNLHRKIPQYVNLECLKSYLSNFIIKNWHDLLQCCCCNVAMYYFTTEIWTYISKRYLHYVTYKVPIHISNTYVSILQKCILCNVKYPLSPWIAAWRSGHCIRLRNRRPGFESVRIKRWKNVAAYT